MDEWDKTIAKEGYWWLPTSPERRVAGTLTFGNTTDGELRLLSGLNNDDQTLKSLANAGVSVEPQIILGQAPDGKKYTLVNCHRSGVTLSAFLVERYIPTIVIEGAHIEQIEEINFDQVTLRLSHLGEWYQKSGRTYQCEAEDRRLKKFSLQYEKPESVTASFGSGRVEFGHDANIQFARFRGDYVISEESCVTVVPDEPTSMYKFLGEVLPPIMHFLALCIGRGLTMFEIRATVGTDATEEEPTPGVSPVTLYWRQERHRDDENELFGHHMVLTHPALGERLEPCLSKWVQSYAEIKPVMQLFFGRVLELSVISSNWFLNSVQAIEAYHRYRRNGRDLPKEAHKARMEEIVSSVPVNHREWLKEKLAFSNEIALASRLRELLTDHESLLEISTEEVEHIVKRMKQLRNYFTHYEGQLGGEFGTGHEFYIYATLIRWVLVCCLLEEAGLTRDEVHTIVAANEEYLYFRNVHLKKRRMKFFEIKDVPSPKAATQSNE